MSEVLKLTKDEIVKNITNDINFKSILKSYKSDLTSAFKVEFNNEYKNGLSEIMYGITINDDLINILVPIFSTEKTITWNFSYLKTIKSLLPETYQKLEDHELVDLIKCPLYYLDKYSGEMIFLSLVSLRDWIDNGNKGGNGFSVYFWNDKLPNKYSITQSELKSNIFEMSLPYYSKKQLKEICLEYATKHHAKFANIFERSAKTIIKNISNGLYVELEVYLQLKNEGQNVRLSWTEGDDFGVDIQLFVENIWLNIDVKSTKTKDLKISKNRKETDFYAVCTWNKGKVVLEGFLFKFHFWKSNVMNTISPEKKNDMYFKSLEDIRNSLVAVNNIHGIFNKYKILNMKRGSRLFNAQ